MATGLRILRAVRANETAQGNMTLPDTAELMKDRVHKRFSCQRAHACTWFHPLMPLTEAEIACHLWSPGSKCPSTIIPTIVFRPFLKTLFHSLLAFEFSSVRFTLYGTMEGIGTIGTESMASCSGDIRGNHVAFLVCPNPYTNSS